MRYVYSISATYWDGVFTVSLRFNPNCLTWFFLIHNRIVNYKTAETWLLWMMKLLHKNAKYLTRKGSLFATQQLNAASEHKRVSVSIAFAEGEAILVGRGPVALLSMLYTGPNLTSLTAGGRIGKMIVPFPIIGTWFFIKIIFCLYQNRIRQGMSM